MHLQRLKGDCGSAILEFIVLGIALNVGILIFSTNIMQIQRDQMVVDSISRHAARLLSRGGTEAEATALANQISIQFGYRADEITLSSSCSSASCDQIGDFVRVSARANNATSSATMPVTLGITSGNNDMSAVDAGE